MINANDNPNKKPAPKEQKINLNLLGAAFTCS